MTTDEIVKKLWEIYDDNLGKSWEVDSLLNDIRELIDEIEDEDEDEDDA